MIFVFFQKSLMYPGAPEQGGQNCAVSRNLEYCNLAEKLRAPPTKDTFSHNLDARIISKPVISRSQRACATARMIDIIG